MFSSLVKGCYWSVLTITFGLIPLWFKGAYSYYTFPDETSIYILIKDGVLLFFIIAVTMSVTIDYHLDDEKSKEGNLLKSAFFVFFPFFIVVTIVAAYFITTVEPDPGKREIVQYLNFGSLFLVLVYAIGCKAYLFYREQL